MTLDDAAIERLVGEARAGDAWAFGLLFDHFHLPIYRYIASRVHRPSDAEDLTQLVFVKALEALPRYESRGIPFGGWLFRLARNTVVDHVRTRHDHADLDAAALVNFFQGHNRLFGKVVVERYLADDDFDGHLARARDVYHELMVFPDPTPESMLHSRWMFSIDSCVSSGNRTPLPARLAKKNARRRRCGTPCFVASSTRTSAS